MALWLDVKYCNMLSPRLDQFQLKSTNPYKVNFRCPICGDSKKNTIKKRAWLFQDQQSVFFKCFNCNAAMSAKAFIRRIDNILYNEYSIEAYKELGVEVPQATAVAAPAVIHNNEPLKKLKKISQLRWDHPAKQYILSRKIENPWHAKIFYCSKFARWTNTMIPGKMSVENDEPRIIFPLLDSNGKMFGYQGRTLNPESKLRYITIILDKQHTKGFGFDSVNPNKTVYVCEGVIDSMFMPNGVAALQGDLLSIKFPNTVYIPDRDVRNKEIMKLAKRIIDKGEKICMLPEICPGKDINEMILNGMCQEEISLLIHKNTYQGLSAQLHFSEWCKISF